MKSIFFLYSEVMPYNVIVYKTLLQMEYAIHVVRYDHQRLTPYEVPNLDNLYWYNRSELDEEAIFELIVRVKPELLYVGGWTDIDYCKVSIRIREKFDLPVVCGSDTQWQGGRQWYNVCTSWFRHKRYFSHIFVTGVWQYEYARRLGFSNQQILINELSADISIFQTRKTPTSENYPKTMMYVGRFTDVKNVGNLIDAWIDIQNKNGWKLLLIGNGTIEGDIRDEKDIIVKDFMTQDDLAIESDHVGAFILPSKFEPWGLVLHEFAAAGLPILATEKCGAVPYFLINGYNGFTCRLDKWSIQNGIEKIINLPTPDLIEMGNRSKRLSLRIDPEIVANTLLSVLK